MIKTVELLGVVVALAWVYFIVTQIVIPGFRGAPLFPFLRSRNRTADRVMHDLNEQIDLAVTGREIEKLKKKLEKQK